MQLQVTNQDIKIIDASLTVSGSLNLYEAAFVFDESWSGYEKTAVFGTLCGDTVMALLEQDKCTIPYAAIEHSGNLIIGVFGVKAEGDKTVRKPTVWSEPLWVKEGVSEGMIIPDPDPSIYEQLLAKVNKPYISLSRLGAYLYDVTFDTIPEFVENEPSVGGGCSSWVQDGKLYRNLDWNYSKTAEFRVTTHNFKGMAFLDDIEDEALNGKENRIGQLPYHVCDGVNDAGIMVSSHVLFNDWDFEGSGDKNVPIYTIPYLVLTNLKSITDIHLMDDYLANIKIPSALAEQDYLLQFLVTDGATTYAILPPNEEGGTYTIENITANPKLTNFRWVLGVHVNRTDLQTRPTGVERWNDIGSNTTLADLRFTKAYESPNRLSEFIGINGTTKDSTDAELLGIYNLAHAVYLNRERDGETWQTVHSAIYSRKGFESLCVQENWDVDYATSGGSSGGASSWDELLDKPFEAIDNNTLISDDGVLKVNTTNDAEPDNTLPITSAGTYVIVGDIETLLSAL